LGKSDRPQPPSAARLLLRLFLSDAQHESIAGDLAEDYALNVLPRLGRARANRWYWRNTLSAVTVRLEGPSQFAPDKERKKPMTGFVQDLRYAARTFRRSPGFAATAVIALALGIGVNTAIFSIFDQMAFRPLPVKDGDRLVGVYETFRGTFSRNMHGNIHMISYPELVKYEEHNQVFTGMAAYANVRALTLAGAQPEAVLGLLVSRNYFRVLGANTAAGRTFLPEECTSPHPVAVLSNPFWQRRFGSDSSVVGKTIRLNQTLFTVVGIAAPDFVGTEPKVPDVWLPLSMQPEVMPDRDVRDFFAAENLSWLSAVGRLKPGVTPRQAKADLSVLAAHRDTLYPGRITQVEITPSAFLNNPAARTVVLVAGALLMVAVGLVLLIACANVANLLLARAAFRHKEIAVRLSLGATRPRLVRQLLTESTLIAVAGGALGLLLARWSLRVGYTIVLSRTAMSPISPDLDLNVLLYTLLLSIGASVMFGLVPALQATNPDLAGSMKDEGALFGQGVSRTRLRNGLISSQVAVCMVLLIGASLLVRGLVNAHSLNPGYRVKDVFLTAVDLRPQGYNDVRATAFYRQLVARLDAEPGVQSALAGHPPLRGIAITGVSLEGQPATEHLPEANFNIVSANYFEVMGIGLSRGRTFLEAETNRATAAGAAVVSEAMAQAYWPGQDSIGKRFRYGAKGTMQNAQVVGVAKDVRSNHISEPDGPSFYLPANPNQPLDLSLVTHAASRDARLTGTIRKLVRGLDPAVLATVGTMEENLEHETSPARVAMALSLGFLALALAAVGIYGVMTYAVSQRTREIGIRMTLGAERSGVLRLMLLDSLRPVFIGMAIGAAIAAAASSTLSKMLLGISPLDPIAFVVVAAFLSGVALLASYIPARRATRVDPMVALRYE
jgi:macrolide transport system ATP-binding/permease protein